MLDLLFSANGRVSRSQFWTGIAVLLGIALLVAVVCFTLSRVIPGRPTADGSYQVEGVAAVPFLVLVFGYLALSFWCGLCLGIKRYHDRGKSGAWVLIQFVPIVGPFWYFIETGFLPGTQGANIYGPEPIGASAAVPASASGA